MYNSFQIKSPKKFLKTLSTLHMAFCAAVLVFSIVILIVIEDYSIFDRLNINSIYYIFPFVAVTVVYASQFIYRSIINNLKPKSDLNKKLAIYQTANVIRYAMIEGPSILCIVACLITNQLVFIIIAWCILAYLYTLKPTKEKLIKDLSLNFEERTELNNA